MKAYIPFTNARRKRLMRVGMANLKGENEALVQEEYPDGSEQLVPANWDSGINAWETVNGKRYYQRGDGQSIGYVMGIPVVHARAENAGVVSAEASMVAQREEDMAFVDGDGRPLEVVETDESGAPVQVTYADDDSGPVAADGGDVNLHYEIDGEVIDRSKAGLFDPFPVSRQEADAAVEAAKNAAQDHSQDLRTLIIGVLLGAGIIVGLIVIYWLLFVQIGGGGGGGGSSVDSTSLMLSLLAGVA